MKEMIVGVEIKFNKENNNYFENDYEEAINPYILIISLLETINDICKDNNLDIKEQLEKYIKMGSIDNYVSDEEKEIMKNLKTFEDN